MNTAVDTTALRTVADLIDDGVRFGLPAPQSVNVLWYGAPTLIMAAFDEVEQWAAYLHTETATYPSRDGSVEHIAAEANENDTYGISVKVTTNRPVAAEVTA